MVFGGFEGLGGSEVGNWLRCSRFIEVNVEVEVRGRGVPWWGRRIGT